MGHRTMAKKRKKVEKNMLEVPYMKFLNFFSEPLLPFTTTPAEALFTRMASFFWFACIALKIKLRKKNPGGGVLKKVFF